MKYAMFESGGKQYIARQGETVEVDHLPLNVGVKAEFKDVLLVSDGSTVRVGTPYVEGATIAAKVVGHVRAPKVIVFKYIPKERYRRKKGHRQQYTRVEIQEIVLPGKAVRREAEEADVETGAPVEEKAPRARKTAAKTKTTKKTSAKGTKTTSKSASKKSTAKKSTRKKSVDKE